MSKYILKEFNFEWTFLLVSDPVLGAGQVGDVCVPGAVNDPLGQDGSPPGLGLHDDALDGVLLHDHVHGEAVKQRSDSTRGHQVVSNDLQSANQNHTF